MWIAPPSVAMWGRGAVAVRDAAGVHADATAIHATTGTRANVRAGRTIQVFTTDLEGAAETLYVAVSAEARTPPAGTAVGRMGRWVERMRRQQPLELGSTRQRGWSGFRPVWTGP